jgi:transposase InsO family protein
MCGWLCNVAVASKDDSVKYRELLISQHGPMPRVSPVSRVTSGEARHEFADHDCRQPHALSQALQEAGRGRELLSAARVHRPLALAIATQTHEVPVFLDNPEPTGNGYNCIVAFTDRLTKRAYISPCHKSSSAKDLTTIFIQTVFRHQGMTRVILSDNGPRFVSEFWKQLFLLLETSIRLTSSYHPQSNGGQEKFNKTLIEVLRTYVSHRQDNWDECLFYFEFAYNNSVNPSTGLSPFILSHIYPVSSRVLAVSRYICGSRRNFTSGCF